MASDSARLERIATLLDQHIEELAGLGLEGTAKVLRLAHLDLKMRMHSITDRELRALCDAIEERNASWSSGRVIAFPARVAAKRTRAR